VKLPSIPFHHFACPPSYCYQLNITKIYEFAVVFSSPKNTQLIYAFTDRHTKRGDLTDLLTFLGKGVSDEQCVIAMNLVRSIETFQSGRHTFFPCRENKIRGYIKRKIAVGRTDYDRRKYKYLKVSKIDVWLAVHRSSLWSKKPTRCHLVLYLLLLYKLLNMFRAILCPSSGADDLVVFLPRVV